MKRYDRTTGSYVGDGQTHPAAGVPRNLVLIGMPGSGKSTTGLLLAKSLCLDFIDTDLLIQKREGQPLQSLIDQNGIGRFLIREQEAILSLDCRLAGTVVATGGSAVFSEPAMKHLRDLGLVIFLDVPLDYLRRRLRNIHARGIAMKPGQSLADIYRDRLPLYRKYADRTVRAGRQPLEQTVDYLIGNLRAEGFEPCRTQEIPAG